MRHIHRKTIMYASIIACVTVVSFPRATEACGESCISCQRLSRGSRSLGRETTDTQVSFFFSSVPKLVRAHELSGKEITSPRAIFFFFFILLAPQHLVFARFSRALVERKRLLGGHSFASPSRTPVQFTGLTRLWVGNNC